MLGLLLLAGVLAILVALACGSLGYWMIFYAWLPDPAGGRLPSDAHIGAVSLPVGAGAMIALGCTFGTLLSGIMAFAVSGFVFAFACGLGAWLGVKAVARWPVFGPRA